MGLCFIAPTNWDITFYSTDFSGGSDRAYIYNIYNLTHTSGYYLSPIYNLGNNYLEYDYKTLSYHINRINISSDISMQFRYTNNVSLGWSAWNFPPLQGNYTFPTNIENPRFEGGKYFQFKVTMQTIDYGERDFYTLNLTYILNNDTIIGYSLNQYRLISPQNRQNPNNIQFAEPIETICITDYFNDILYEVEMPWQAFIDIGLSIFTLTLINLANYTIIIDVCRGYGVYLEMAIMSNSEISIQALATDYRVTIRDLNNKVLQIFDVCANRSRMVTYTYTINKTITPPSVSKEFIITCVLLGATIGAIVGNTILNWYQTRSNFVKVRRKQKVEESIMFDPTDF
jgi:hypothetical protein